MMARNLAAELLDALEGWQDASVMVRLVARNDELVAVFSGRLDTRSGEKGQSLFWPVEPDGTAPALFEQPGIYVHPELLSDVSIHPGEFVVEFAQAGVTVNLRRLN